MGPLEQLDQLGPLLGQVASGVTPADLDSPTPCANFTVRGVLDHMLRGASGFAAAFRGEPAPQLPDDIGDGPDVVAIAGAKLGDLIAAIQSPGALDRTVAAPFGEMPGEAFARFVVLDGLVHGWDLAVATRQSYEPSDELVADVEAFARQAIADPMRDGDTFAAATTAPAGATPIERLAALTGRTV
ncbi:MAG: TIGR03086 family protein [Acidimicrobiia bacterium]|nr:TIGR03086 family protein [Acidimicrobiia bacterium]